MALMKTLLRGQCSIDLEPSVSAHNSRRCMSEPWSGFLSKRHTAIRRDRYFEASSLHKEL